jgi:hypothetical protein
MNEQYTVVIGEISFTSAATALEAMHEAASAMHVSAQGNFWKYVGMIRFYTTLM